MWKWLKAFGIAVVALGFGLGLATVLITGGMWLLTSTTWGAWALGLLGFAFLVGWVTVLVKQAL